MLIRNGTVVTDAATFEADVYAEKETITLIGTNLRCKADVVIDARGKYVLPGAVDPHTHFDLDYAGTTTCDNFTSGTVAAAFGGTTTVIDFCFQRRGDSLHATVEKWLTKLRRHEPVIDVGFHVAVTDLEMGSSPAELAELPSRGITSFKLFMAYSQTMMASDETLFRVMEVAAGAGAVALVHAENGSVIDLLTERALRAGHVTPRWHAETRPPLMEAEATNRAIMIAQLAGAPLYVVHVSCGAAAEVVRDARLKGWDVSGETCPQYLFTDASCLGKPGFEGAKYVFTPPPRDIPDQSALWAALASDTLSVVSSDHVAYRWHDQKAAGKDNFALIPAGAPGVEERVILLHSYGVHAGAIDLNRLVALTSTNPARLFGLFPRKGAIQVGSDADLVVFDPNQERTLSAASQHSTSDYSVYEGMHVIGTPIAVTVRGTVVVQDGALVAEPGHGRFIQRQLRTTNTSRTPPRAERGHADLVASNERVP